MLSEKSRSAIYRGLASVVDDEEAVEEMLSHFPAREVEELVTKDFLRAEMAELRAEMRTELHREIGGLRGEMHDGFGALRGEMQSEIRRSVMWMVTVSVTGWGLIIAATAGIVAGLG